MKKRTIMRGRMSAMVAWLAVILAVHATNAGESVSTPENSLTWFDTQKYQDIMDSKVNSLRELGLDHEQQEAMLLPILPPTMDYLEQPLSNPTAVDFEGLPKQFIKGLEPEYHFGIPHYPITITRDPNTLRTLFYNKSGDLIGSTKPSKETEAWYSAARASAAQRDPGSLGVRYDLITEEDVAREVAQTSASTLPSMATQSSAPPPPDDPGDPGDGDGTSGDGEPTGAFRFWNIEKTAEGIALHLDFPPGFTEDIDLFQCDDLVAETWELAEEHLSTAGGPLEWTETDLSQAMKFWAFGSCADPDSDLLESGREYYLYKTDPSLWSTDSDPISDYDELFVYGTDPINTHNSPLPYVAGFEIAAGYSTGNLNTQNGWEGGSGTAVQQGPAHMGTQAVEMEAVEASMTKHFATTDDSATIELFLFLAPQFFVPTNLPDGVSSMVSYEEDSGIKAFDGNGSGGGSWVTAPGTLNLINQWVEFKIVQDYVTQTWSLFVDDSLKLPNLGFRDSSVVQLGALNVRSGMGGAVLCDDVTIQ